MNKIFKLISTGSLFAFIATAVLCFSECAGLSTNVSFKEDTSTKVDTAGYAAY